MVRFNKRDPGAGEISGLGRQRLKGYKSKVEADYCLKRRRLGKGSS